jgi:RimJ/RimL family protein N-acetyltransferase
MLQPINIIRTRLSLRELNAADADAIHSIYGNPQVTEHLSFEPRTRDEVAAIVGRWIGDAAAEPRTEYALAVTLPNRRDAVGLARLAIDPHQQRAATIGFALRRDQWGQGLGAETVRALSDLAFGTLGLHRIWAARSPANSRSAQTLARAGMTEEGRIRGHVYVHGAWRDSIVYGLLAEEVDGDVTLRAGRSDSGRTGLLNWGVPRWLTAKRS